MMLNMQQEASRRMTIEALSERHLGSACVGHFTKVESIPIYFQRTSTTGSWSAESLKTVPGVAVDFDQHM